MNKDIKDGFRLVSNFQNDVLAQQNEYAEKYIKYVIKKNYPGVNVDDDKSLKEFMENERISYRTYYDDEVSFRESENGYSVKVESTIKVFKEIQ